MYNSYTRVRGFFNAATSRRKGCRARMSLQCSSRCAPSCRPRYSPKKCRCRLRPLRPNSLRDNLRKARESARRGRMDLSRRRPAQRERRGLYARIPRQRRRRTDHHALFQALAQARHPGGVPQGGFCADPEAARRVRLRSVHRAHSGQRVARQRAAWTASARSRPTPRARAISSACAIPRSTRCVNQAVSANTRPELVASLRALDRVLRHGHYVVPQWFSSTYRVAYRSGKFEQPAVAPQYYQAEDWVISTWWRKK